jgi:hypothetical protein
MRLTRRFGVLIGVGALATGCGEPRYGTAQQYQLRTGGAGAGVDMGALQDLGAYTPATFDPLPAPQSAIDIPAPAAGSTDPAAAGAVASVREFLVAEAGGLLAGNLSGVVKRLAEGEAAAFSDERQSAIAPTFEKYLVFRRVLVSKFGEGAGTAADRLLVGSAEQWGITPVTSSSASVGPHPYTVVLGRRRARSGSAWTGRGTAGRSRWAARWTMRRSPPRRNTTGRYKAR